MSDYPPAARSVLLVHFHTGSLENKDTGLKPIAPLNGNSPPNAPQINLYHVCEKKMKKKGLDLNRLVYELTLIFLPNFIKTWRQIDARNGFLLGRGGSRVRDHGRTCNELVSIFCPTLSGISSIVCRELTFRLFTGSKARHASEATSER